jgi:hypothetical protein
MKKFPDSLKPENKDNFNNLAMERFKCYLRRDLYEHIITHREDEYFSLDEFNKRVNNMTLTNRLVDELMDELKSLGWNCKKSYGDTGLFIYSSEKPPHNCW